MSLHPVHLTKNNEGQLPPSALIPFCSYQLDGKLLGKENLTICDKFQPKILDGQLCYSLDVANFGESPAGQGAAKTLFLLLDQHPNPSNSVEIDNLAQKQYNDPSNFKIYIHTLAQYSGYGRGDYNLNSLKRITATESFKQLPDNQKHCQVHNREKCQTQKFLEHVQNNCRCTPWALMSEYSREMVCMLKSLFYFIACFFHHFDF